MASSQRLPTQTTPQHDVAPDEPEGCAEALKTGGLTPWRERLAKQLVHEVVVDREFVNNCFANDGGAKRLNVVLDNQLDTVLSELGETLWQAS